MMSEGGSPHSDDPKTPSKSPPEKTLEEPKTPTYSPPPLDRESDDGSKDVDTPLQEDLLKNAEDEPKTPSASPPQQSTKDAEVSEITSEKQTENRENLSKNIEKADKCRERTKKRRKSRSRSRSPRHKRHRKRSSSREHRKSRDKRSRKSENDVKKESNENDDSADWFAKKRKDVDPLNTKAGGAYIPPAKLRAMQAKAGDKASERAQRIAWELLKKKIHGHVNKVNVANLVKTVTELMAENIVRGKGLLARSIIQAQAFSPTFSHVYAALVAVINSKFPHIGELVLRRLIIQFKRSFKRNDKATAVTVTKFLAHLINQQVAHEVLALEVLTLLLETPTDDSVEVAIAFLKESGAKLSEVTPRGVAAIFDRLRSILHESTIDKRVQYMIEVIFSIRKDKFTAHPPLIEELDLVEEQDQITHTITLEDAQDPENMLNVFRVDSEYEKNEEMYAEIRKEILGEGSDDESDDEEDAEGDEEEEQKATTIVDNTETNLVAFRRTVYLTIQSSLDYQEAVHKLLKMEIKPGMEVELCHMIIDCCAQQRTYEKFYGLLAERFCRLRREYQEHFQMIFRDTYDTIHRFEIMKLRNTTKLFAHLLFTDAISWEILGNIKLNEDDTTSSSRICIKVLFQELAEYMGLDKLYARINDPTFQAAFEGLFPRDNPRDTRFSINFFTSIGLGGLTVDLREHLKSGPKQLVSLPELPDISKKEEESSSSDSSDSSSSDSSDSSSSSDSASSDDGKKRNKKQQKAVKEERRSRDRDAWRDQRGSRRAEEMRDRREDRRDEQREPNRARRDERVRRDARRDEREANYDVSPEQRRERRRDDYETRRETMPEQRRDRGRDEHEARAQRSLHEREQTRERRREEMDTRESRRQHDHGQSKDKRIKEEPIDYDEYNYENNNKQIQEEREERHKDKRRQRRHSRSYERRHS